MGKPKSAEPPVKGPIKPIFSVLPGAGVGAAADAAAAGAVAAGDAAGVDDADVAAGAATGVGVCAAADTAQQAVTVKQASAANCLRASVLRR